MKVCASVRELSAACEGILRHDGATVQVQDGKKLREQLMDTLVHTAVFSDCPETRGTARWLIKMAAQETGAIPASIQSLYDAMGRGETRAFTVPAVNVRGMAYDTARALIRAAQGLKVGAFIFEIAKSEMGYTGQEPHEYAAVVLAAAVREGFTGPVFIQGDHFQINAKRYAEAPQEEISGLEKLIANALSAGFYNIDIDTSTLVTLEPAELSEQQRENYTLCARFTKFIREHEPAGITVSVGGEIGEVGLHNSTVEEFRAFMAGYLACDFGGGKPISKMSVQTGTSHGGVPLPDGSIADVNLDFGVLQSIGACARKDFGLSGAVQHGASTLPDHLFNKFPSSCASEIHLATGFQNLVMDHPALPDPLKADFRAHVRDVHAKEYKAGKTDEQNFYSARKKGWGSWKREWWSMDPAIKAAVFADLQKKFAFLMEQLAVADTRDVVAKHVTPAKTAFSLGEEIAACSAGFAPRKLDAKYESALAD